MFQKKLKWYWIFDSKEELENHFAYKSAFVHKTMFGEYLMIKHENEFYAFKNKCPHQKKSLEGCLIEYGKIICPFHKYKFSLETGRGHGLYVDRYPLKFNEEGVFVGKEVFSLF